MNTQDGKDGINKCIRVAESDRVSRADRSLKQLIKAC